MDPSSRFAGATVTPAKDKATYSHKSKLNANSNHSENYDPNVSSPRSKLCNSPSVVKSENSARKSVSRKAKTNQINSPLLKKKIRERKLQKEDVNSSGGDAVCVKCKKAMGKSKCLCVAYESLRASHEEFLKNRGEIENEICFNKVKESEITGIHSEGGKEKNYNLFESNGENDELGLRRSRDRLLEKARESVPEPGSGRVMHLVKAFEELRMIPKSGVYEENDVEEDDKKVTKWALPGLQQPPKASEIKFSSSSLSPSDFFVTSESLGLDSGRSYSLDSSQGSISRRTSSGGRRSRRSSTESSVTQKKRYPKRKQKKEKSQKPFMLRTEQRGRSKEEEFMKKLQQMLEEEEKLRQPVAQGLPWTTDEPEFLARPPVKENTRPVDLVLHSDTRAAERAEFDNQVIMKMNLIKRYRMERERQQKQEEEEEIRRLRKELVPKAQPMPYFDRPFIPRRSMKQPTLPRDPKFHLPQNKKVFG